MPALVAGPIVLPAAAQPVVQSVPAQSGSQALNAALSRLARDPRDLAALIDAGNGALQMGDVDAAIGFFARADQVSPNNMRVKAGLAGALVRSENPFDAIPLFAEAEKAQVMDAGLLADRGLAYDLVGDSATAQRLYRQSLTQRIDDETLRRLALSQAIAGDRAGMELTLSPLLQRQDKAAWRTRAFALAILGRGDEAVNIANQSMPADLASGIAPYLRYMPRLTPAQQAAAANFGRFPRAAEIGRDDPRVALYAPPRRVASADAGLVPAGEPLGRSRTRRDSRGREGQGAAPAPANASVPLPTPRPAIVSAPPEPIPSRQENAASARATAQSVLPAPRPVVAAPPASPAPPAASASTTAPAPLPSVTPAPAMASASGFNLARVGAEQAPAAIQPAPAQPPAPARPAAAQPAPAQAASLATAPVQSARTAAVPASPALAVAAPAQRGAAPVPAAPAARPRRVADAFADLSVPTKVTSPAPGAVDIRKIAPAKPKPVEPPKPVHPSRIWVQVGTGRDIKALGFTWRGLVKDNPELFRGKEASVSDWGRTNRLLTGPFATDAAASAYLARLRKNEIDAFAWTSPAGQVVDDLPGK